MNMQVASSLSKLAAAILFLFLKKTTFEAAILTKLNHLHHEQSN